ncbi:potassium channel family protein [Undibacterium fentianense]|uniref:Potassium channel protein n=1 Tax=Undibacterium fentianense TaxID=2828728 RepID=A0A941E492_9BURK|nr:potassium channel protein [Undibacterium fentianense]MBR7800902.1 potassium channel protein [Undibacterium fentianense]
MQIPEENNPSSMSSHLPVAESDNAQLMRILARIGWATLILLTLILFGTIGFYLFSDRSSWENAIYMTLITISTVGYGEGVPLTSFGAKVFAGVMSIAGLGVLTFLFTSLTVFFLEKDLDYSLRRRRMEKRIRKLRQHFIVCGFGRVGRNVAHELQKTGRQFVAIDPEQNNFDEYLDKFPDLLYLAGDASDDDLLIDADIGDARGLFAVTGDDSRNLMIIITAKQLNPRLRIVARAHELRNVEKMRKAGADEVISPDFTGGMRMASAMVRPHVVSFLDEMLKSEKNLRVEEVVTPSDFPATAMGKLRLRSPDYILIAVRARNDWTFNPDDQYLLRAGDVIVAMTSAEGRAEIERHLLDMI